MDSSSPDGSRFAELFLFSAVSVCAPFPSDRIWLHVDSKLVSFAVSANKLHSRHSQPQQLASNDFRIALVFYWILAGMGVVKDQAVGDSGETNLADLKGGRIAEGKNQSFERGNQMGGYGMPIFDFI